MNATTFRFGRLVVGWDRHRKWRYSNNGYCRAIDLGPFFIEWYRM